MIPKIHLSISHCRRLRTICLISWSLSVALPIPPVCAADLSDIDQLVSRAEGFAARGKPDEAESDFRSALELTVGKFGSFHAATAGLNRRLASFLLDQNRTAEAERCLQKALVITSGYSPAAALDGEFRGVSVFTNNALQNPDQLPGSFELADVLEGYASLYASQGRYSDAERLLKTATRVYEDGAANRASTGFILRGDSHELFLRAMTQLAFVQSKQSKVVEAEQTFTRAASITRARKGATSPELAEVLRSLARFYRCQGRTSDAEAAESEAASQSR